MTNAILVAIGLMWLPVALLFLGKGEAKGTGFATAVVGILTLLSALAQTAIFKDPFTGGLLLAHGTFYLTVSYALLTGLQDMRSVGNVALTVALVSTVYCVMFYVGTPQIPVNNYLGLMCLGYAVITFEVWLNAFGKVSAKVVAYSLIVWVPVGLWIPAFHLMGSNKLPF
jgi:3',5'-cyclic AMP phosphodiesterase CpdA